VIHLHDSEGVGIDLKGVAHYFKFIADGNFTAAQSCSGIYLIPVTTAHQNIANAFQYLKFSVENGIIEEEYGVG
jgi:hypothetical protein